MHISLTSGHALLSWTQAKLIEWNIISQINYAWHQLIWFFVQSHSRFHWFYDRLWCCLFAQLFINGRLPLLMPVTWKTISNIFIFFSSFFNFFFSSDFQTLIDLNCMTEMFTSISNFIPLDISLLCITSQYTYFGQ